MKKIDFKILIVTCIACALPIIFGLICYDQLPSKMAVHWGLLGNDPNNSAPKNFALFGIPAIMVATQIILCVCADVGDKNKA